eukprot:5950382-Prymnesium_polylepis.1
MGALWPRRQHQIPCPGTRQRGHLRPPDVVTVAGALLQAHRTIPYPQPSDLCVSVRSVFLPRSNCVHARLWVQVGAQHLCPPPGFVHMANRLHQFTCSGEQMFRTP